MKYFLILIILLSLCFGGQTFPALFKLNINKNKIFQNRGKFKILFNSTFVFQTFLFFRR